MDICEILKEAASEYCRKNALAKCGEIVEAIWAGWKKPRKIMIYQIGANLSDTGYYNEKERKWEASFVMFYYAKRLVKDGSIFHGDFSGGIVLDNFKKADGTVWKENRGIINSSAYHWEYESLSL